MQTKNSCAKDHMHYSLSTNIKQTSEIKCFTLTEVISVKGIKKLTLAKNILFWTFRLILLPSSAKIKNANVLNGVLLGIGTRCVIKRNLERIFKM